jgi:hypothetical protein
MQSNGAYLSFISLLNLLDKCLFKELRKMILCNFTECFEGPYFYPKFN